jgi:hypothetical protein
MIAVKTTSGFDGKTTSPISPGSFTYVCAERAVLKENKRASVENRKRTKYLQKKECFSRLSLF